MDRNGVTTSFEEPDHQALSTFTIDGINASRYSEIRRVGSDLWDHEVFFSGPVTPADVEFLDVTHPLRNTNQPISIICVEGIAGDSYEFEYVQHIEVIGSAAASRTPSHADPQTFGKVLEAAKETAYDGPLNAAKTPSMIERFFNAAKALGPSIVSAGKMIPALLAGEIPQGLLEASKLQKALMEPFSMLRAGNYKAIQGTGPRGQGPPMTDLQRMVAA